MINARQCLQLVIAAVGAGLCGTAATAGELEDYLKKPDPAFAWSVAKTETTAAGKIHTIDLTSQVWHGITWKHNLTVYEPAKPEFAGPMVLLISGGSTGSQPKLDDHVVGFSLAKLCGARIAVLRQVPNQPLLGDLKEDDLISETFLRYLETKDATWPLLLPMVKSAVKAMDALQEFGTKQNAKPEQFVVTGASKRGWTTWLTGAMDPRVIAIAPMVLPHLNFEKQNPHQLEVWGKYSEQIDDYVRKGLMEKLKTEDGKKLTRIVDPYFYRSRLSVPKLQILGTNDRYWTLDCLNLYWDELSAPKNVVYLPNAGHGLDKNRDYALHGIAAWFRHAVTNRPLPDFKWQHSDDPSSKAARVEISVRDGDGPRPKSVKLWTATTPQRDFREATWSAGPPAALPKGTAGGVSLLSEPPDKGWFALFADLTCDIDGVEYHLSTPIRVIGPKSK